MDEREAFLGSAMPGLREAETALHNGDAAPRSRIWSHNDPVTLFGAAFAASGWSPISKIFDTLASRFSKCRSWEYEIVAADASGDLAYIVGIEHTTAAVGGAAPEPYRLRVTTVFRREDGVWKVVHRHADPVPDDTGTPAQLARFKDQQPGR